jgi:hypothetical protein
MWILNFHDFYFYIIIEFSTNIVVLKINLVFKSFCTFLIAGWFIPLYNIQLTERWENLGYVQVYCTWLISVVLLTGFS